MPYNLRIKRQAPLDIFTVGSQLGCNVIGRTLACGARDTSGSHTPPTDLRAGLAMGEITATGYVTPVVSSAVDGSATTIGLLADDQTVIDENGTDITGLPCRLIRKTFDAIVASGRVPNYSAQVRTDLLNLVDFGP